MHIPFYVITHKPRRTLEERVFEVLREYECRHLYANLEHEVDELRRDIRIWELGEKHGVQVNFFHNKCIIEPGVVLTKQARGYTVGALDLYSSILIHALRYFRPIGEIGSTHSTQDWESILRNILRLFPIRNLSDKIKSCRLYFRRLCPIPSMGLNSAIVMQLT